MTAAKSCRMSLKKVADMKPQDSPKPIEIRVLKKWKPFAPDERKKPDLWFLFVDVHVSFYMMLSFMLFKTKLDSE